MSPERPHGRPFPLHVLVLPTVPLFAVWAGNADQLRSLYPLHIAVILAAGTLVLTMILTIVQRDWRRSGLVAVGLVLSGTTIGHVLEDPTRWALNLGVLGIITLGLVAVASRLTDGAVQRATLLLNVMACALVLANGAVIVANRPATMPLAHLPEADATNAGPDVWFLVPDRLPSEATLMELGIDASALFDGLRDRGFDIADDARANYPQTALSLAAAWGMDYLDASGSVHDVRSQASSRLAAPPIGRLFQDAGHHYTHLGSWAEFSSTSASADDNVSLAGAHEFWNAWTPTTLLPTFLHVLGRRGPARVVVRAQVEHATHQLQTLERLATRPDGAPRFVLAHLILPHAPYVFHEDGSVRDDHRFATDAEEAAAYRDQLSYVGTELLSLIDRLQERREPPVVVLLADEGLYPSDLRAGLESEDIPLSEYTDADFRRKLSVLAAVYDPTGTIGDIEDDTTAVNVTRSIARGLLDVPMPALPDRVYRYRGDGSRDLVPLGDEAGR